MTQFDWPGNVRELRNALENAMIFARGKEIQLGDLPSEVRTAASVGLHRQSLQEKLRELGIHRPGKAGSAE